MELLKLCPKCKTVKTTTDFIKLKSSPDGLYSYCKECHRKSNRESYQRNRSEKLKKNADWIKRNAERYREKKRVSTQKYRAQNRDKFREYGRQFYKKRAAHERALQRKRNKNPAKALLNKEYHKNWRANNPLRSRAHGLVKQAILNGILKRPLFCEKCGEKGSVDAHHVDYAKPLKVTWLCKSCHLRLHAALRRNNDSPTRSSMS